MNLIFLYGPPGVGKLTVAKELARVTDYRIFHNHLTVDLVESIFPFGSEMYTYYVRLYRLQLIEAAARAGVKGIIMTFFYVPPKDNLFIRKLESRVKKHVGRMFFVQPSCDVKELKKRLKHPDRRRYLKMNKIKTLDRVMKHY